MCKIYNSIGSLTTIKTQLSKHNVHDLTSLKEVIDFRKSYPAFREQLISQYKDLLENEKITLQAELCQLDSAIENQKLLVENEINDQVENLKQQLNNSKSSMPTNCLLRLAKHFKELIYSKKIRNLENNSDFKVNAAIRNLMNLRQEKSVRYQYIQQRFDDAVKRSYTYPLAELERKKRAIDDLNPFILGALGEQKVVKTLQSLSDEYFLINDFSISFSPPLYNSQERDYIKSVQIDHILIAPSGVFLIETKNWSEKSLEDFNLRSPVEQIKRTSFVLFKLLNNKMANSQIHLAKHHWGDKKISIRSLIVLINSKPKEEFKHVKILTLKELIGYIRYFEPVFSNTETQSIADYLQNINNQKVIAISNS